MLEDLHDALATVNLCLRLGVEVRPELRERRQLPKLGEVPFELSSNLLHSFELGRGFGIDENILRERVCVIGSAVREGLFFYADPIDQFISVNGKRFRVVGVLTEKGERRSDDDSIIVPYYTGADRLGLESFSGVEIQADARSSKHVELASKQIRELLYARHPRIPFDPEAEDFDQAVIALNALINAETE